MATHSNPLLHRLPALIVLTTTLAAGMLMAKPARAQEPGKRGLTPEQQGAAATAVENGKYYALVIGINTYPAPLPSLKTAQNDAQAVAKVLHESYGFDVKTLLGMDATRQHILEAINRYEASLRPNDNLLIYYAGHGFENKTTNKAYWLPADADSTNSSNRIIADDITSEMAAIPARHILVISDSCYSGGLSRDADVIPVSKGQDAFLRKMLEGRSRTLMASGGDEPVSDSGAEGHSVFAYALLKSLEQQDQSLFTASDLFYGAVQRRVASNSEQVPQYAIIRNSGNDSMGDFVFTRRSASTKEIATKLAAPAPDFNRGAALYDAKQYSEAIPPLTSACDTGSFRACAALSLMYMQGMGTPVNFVRAVSLGNRSCDGGEAVACTNLALLYQNGHGVLKDEAKAAALNRKACVGGEPAGCFGLGIQYATGRGVSKDIAQSVSLYLKACDAGETPACLNLALLYRDGKDLPHDDAKAFGLFQKACDGDNGDACNSLGYMHLEGQFVTKNAPLAALLYEKACDEGQFQACSNLALLYEAGSDIPKDMGRAVLFQTKACDGNLAVNCTYLANMLTDGKRIKQDMGRAITLYRKACEMNEPIACYNLGQFIESGSGVAADKNEAAATYRKACSLGDKDGCVAAERIKP